MHCLDTVWDQVSISKAVRIIGVPLYCLRHMLGACTSYIVKLTSNINNSIIGQKCLQLLNALTHVGVCQYGELSNIL